jgi:hypothetical protein
MSDTIIKWIGIISSALTVLLAVLSFNLNRNLQKTDQMLKQSELALKQAESELKAKIDSSKEKTSRYEFVNKLLPDLLNKDKTKVVLTTNLVTLVLSDEESRKLFSGFVSSSNKEVQTVGKEAIANIKEQNNKLTEAISKEKLAFDELIQGNIDKAISAFEAVERIYPTFHQAYEIATFLKHNTDKFQNERKNFYRKIYTDFGTYASKEQRIKLEELSRS